MGHWAKGHLPRGVHTPNLFSFDSPAAAQKGVIGNGHGLSVGMDQGL